MSYKDNAETVRHFLFRLADLSYHFPSENVLFHFLFKISCEKEVPMEGGLLELIVNFKQLSHFERVSVLTELAEWAHSRLMLMSRQCTDEARREVQNEPMEKNDR